jgi:hypothetical protein
MRASQLRIWRNGNGTSPYASAPRWTEGPWWMWLRCVSTSTSTWWMDERVSVVFQDDDTQCSVCVYLYMWSIILRLFYVHVGIFPRIGLSVEKTFTLVLLCARTGASHPVGIRAAFPTRHDNDPGLLHRSGCSRIIARHGTFGARRHFHSTSISSRRGPTRRCLISRRPVQFEVTSCPCICGDGAP